MPIFYPDNEDRGNRVAELISDISNNQQYALDTNKNMDGAIKRILPTLDQIKASHGLKTNTELVELVGSKLPASEKAKYTKLVEDSKDTNGALDDTTLVISCVVLSFTTVNLSVRFGGFIAKGALTVGIKTALFGLKLMSEGNIAAGARLFARSARLARGFAQTATLSESATKAITTIARYAKIAGWISFALDGIVVILSAIIGSIQKDKLQEAIKNLLPRRLVIKLLQLQAGKAQSFVGRIESYLDDSVKLPTYGIDAETVKKILQGKADDIARDIEHAEHEEDLDTVYKLLKTLDEGRHSWTNEDSSLNEIKVKIAQEHLESLETADGADPKSI